MLILMDIEGLMSSADMGLINDCMKLSLTQRLWLPTIVLAIVITAIGGFVALRTQTQVQATADRQQAAEARLERALQASGLGAGAMAPVRAEVAEIHRLRVEVGEQRKSTVAAVLVVMAVIVAYVAGATRTLVRAIRDPLAELAAVAERMGDGDLTPVIDSSRSDEIGVLARSVAGMRDALATLVRQAQHSSDSIRTASAEVASGNADLSQRTERAAGALQQTASSMEQLTGTVQQTAERAQPAPRRRRAAPAARPSAEARSWPTWCARWTRSAPARGASARSRPSSTASRSRPTSWRSTPRSRPRGPASRAAALPWWPARCARWRSAAPRRRARSARSSPPAASRSRPAPGCVGDAGQTMQQVVEQVRLGGGAGGRDQPGRSRAEQRHRPRQRRGRRARRHDPAQRRAGGAEHRRGA
jgi:HAMP domain-containing protein